MSDVAEMRLQKITSIRQKRHEVGTVRRAGDAAATSTSCSWLAPNKYSVGAEIIHRRKEGYLSSTNIHGTMINLEDHVRTRNTLLTIFSVVLLAVSFTACGGDDNDQAGDAATDTSEAADDKGEIVNVELGESADGFFLKPDKDSVKAGKITFAVTNNGKLYHEFIAYTNKDDVAPTALPVKDNEAALVEADIIGEAPYATPPIVPPDKKPGDADHRIRSEGWGAELTVDMKPGKYILLCNVEGHYANKQAAAFEVK